MGFCDLRKIDNRNIWKNYVIVTRVELSVELDVLVIREKPIFIQLIIIKYRWGSSRSYIR